MGIPISGAEPAKRFQERRKATTPRLGADVASASTTTLIPVAVHDGKTLLQCWFPRTVELFDEERHRLEIYLPEHIFLFLFL
ncbi:hypothetical protein EVAR_80140_1 [Eumeta japonica]|uniref:Uncharacterized protein n=1 Tax=Eumeta variegata TaxID=151549 RepID=A0A4C1YE49_EUMVA|nr:hypothetical protein EVAR_80140_1 [Eumeta japonica]